MSNAVMKMFKEPLIHFILIGSVFFIGYSIINRPAANENVLVSAEDIQTLKVAFSNDWNRVAAEEEVEILIEDLVREELAVREGIAIGLDEGDPVVRQRIRQKLELLVEEDAVVGEPTDEELAIYHKENWDLFRNRDGSVPPLEEIRNLVIFEWENTQRMNQLEQFYKDLESKYGVEIERH